MHEPSAAACRVRHVALRCPVQDPLAIGPDTRLQIAASVFLPAGGLPAAPQVYCCLPGGALSRAYYDLVSDGEFGFSFARQLAARGAVVVTLDPLGTGQSSRPEDGFAITPEAIAAANAQAVEHVLQQLRAGALEPGLPALPGLVPIGVGHSLGAVCTIVQQAHLRSYRALVLLGYGGAGFPSELNAQELALADKPQAIRAQIVRLARARYVEPYGRIVASPRTREVYGGGGDKGAMAALRAAGTELLSTAGLYSMIPGSTREEAAALDVPVFLGIGDRDICGPPHAVPACFPRSRDIQLLVLPDTGHTHFVFQSARALYARIHAWAGTVLAPGER
jgi:pimeloyl-ACP methyl ester carboxylesterase